MIRLAILRIRLLMTELSIAAAEAQGVYSPLLIKRAATLRGHIATATPRLVLR